MRRIAVALSVSFLVSCAEDGPLTDEQCTLVDPDQCGAQECGSDVEMREIVAEEPTTDDECFGEATRICVRDPEEFENSALCLYAWRGSDEGARVLRLNSTEVPPGWSVCHGEDDEPPGCVCHDVAGCSR